MPTALRAIVIVLFGFGLTVASGCGSKPTPTDPNVTITPSSGQNPNPDPVATEAVWEMDVTKHAIPAGPVTGRLAGERVTAAVRIEGNELFLEKPVAMPGDDWSVRIVLPPDALRGNSYRLVVSKDEVPGPDLLIEFPKPVGIARPLIWNFQYWDSLKILGWQAGCALTLELGRRENRKVSGKVYLAIPEMETAAGPPLRNFLAGSFVADCPRLPTDPPGVEDLPFINGSVTVNHAPPNAVLIAGYAAVAPSTNTACGSTEISLGELTPKQYTGDKPRVTTLLAGDGKATASRYEHSKLNPGRYLVFAALKNGPVVWKWVDLPENGTITADLTIDAANTGGLEVTAPLEAVGNRKRVQLAPADDPLHSSLGQFMCDTITPQLNLEQEFVASKALFKNLGPGRYEVRAAGQSRVVEIVAGKTLELDFDKKALPPKPPTPAPDPKPKG